MILLRESTSVRARCSACGAKFSEDQPVVILTGQETLCLHPGCAQKLAVKALGDLSDLVALGLWEESQT